jgi:hypothetical protein
MAHLYSGSLKCVAIFCLVCSAYAIQILGVIFIIPSLPLIFHNQIDNLSTFIFIFALE